MSNTKRKWALGSLAAIIVAVPLFFLLREWILQQRDFSRRASCGSAIVLTTCYRYASEHDRQFPELSSTPGKLIYDGEKLEQYLYPLPNYVCDFGARGPSDEELRQSSDPSLIDDWSYVYLGYFIENEEQAFAFLDAYRRVIQEDGTFDDNLHVGEGRGNLGSDVLYRLRDPATLPDDLAPLAEKAAEIPVVIEWPGNHRHMGGHVQYLDGHREYVRYPGKFPMTEAFIKGLVEIDAEFSKNQEPITLAPSN